MNGVTIIQAGHVLAEIPLDALQAYPHPVGVRRRGRLSTVPEGGIWEGVPILTILQNLHIASAPYVVVTDGDFRAAFRSESLGRRGMILACWLDGRPIPLEQGGPVRLVFLKGACFESVRAVARIELVDSAVSANAQPRVRAGRTAIEMSAGAKAAL